MYERVGKRKTTYYTITPANEYVGLGHDLIAAKRLLIDLEEGRSAPGTVAELLDDCVAELRRLVQAGKRAPRTLADRETDIVNLKEAFGRMRPIEIQPQHVWQYLHKYRGVEAPVRANREITFLQSAFDWARGQGIVTHNPCVGVARNEETPRDRLVDDAELAAFQKHCRDHGHIRLSLAAEIAYLTGKGQAQVLRLSKAQISDDGIEFGKRKGGSRTKVGWTPRLRTAIDEALAMKCKVEPMFVLHGTDGSPYTSGGFKGLWQKMMKAWGEAGHERFTFHDLRAKAVTDMIDQGRKASDLTGHKSEAVIARVYDRRAVRTSTATK